MMLQTETKMNNNLATTTTTTTPPPLPERPDGPSTAASTMPSRPLSEISENERRSHRLSYRSVKESSRPASRSASRPSSQVDEKRLSAQIQTITLNLNDYASAVKRPASAVSNKSRDSLVLSPVASSSRPTKPDKPLTLRTTSISSIKEIQREAKEEETMEGHPLLVAKRASLRPSPLGSTYADVLKPTSPISSTGANESVLSLELKSNKSWLRRASGTSRAKSKSPVPDEPSPPALPPRKPTTAPPIPRKTSYASVAAGPSLPSSTSIRDRISAWTSQSNLPRSESTATLASMAPSYRQDRFTSAQRMIGSAGSAVQKGWAGLRARGVGGSISNMSSLAPRRESLDPPKVSRKASRERSVSAQATTPDGPVLDGSVRRQAGFRPGLVFGKDLSAVGREWGVVHEAGLSERELQRRSVLPAVVVRCVDYLTIWGPKEEGMFRISGRSSHVARLRREFDSGADLDLRECHPGDLDPHAISGTLKSYLRELPSPLLSTLQPRFEAAIKADDDIGELLPLLPVSYWFLLSDLVSLLSLIAKHTETNRMTIKSLMLSLGPSLNIPGNVFTVLIDRREELFKTPPSGELDFCFGETSIPVLDPTDAPAPPEKPKRSPLLPSKPSLTRLFGANPPIRRGSTDTTVSSISAAPPRVELRTDSPRLPSFESDRLEPIISASNTMQDVQLKDEARNTTPTPIADMFAGQSQLPPLRHQKSGLGASTSVPEVSVPFKSASAPVRRGQTGFFGGGHGRTQSLAVVRKEGPPALPPRPEKEIA